MADKEQTVEPPDMNRYYYRPGTTEPELRPEFVEAEKAAAAEKQEKPKAAATKKASRKK